MSTTKPWKLDKNFNNSTTVPEKRRTKHSKKKLVETLNPPKESETYPTKVWYIPEWEVPLHQKIDEYIYLKNNKIIIKILYFSTKPSDRGLDGRPPKKDNYMSIDGKKYYQEAENGKGFKQGYNEKDKIEYLHIGGYANWERNGKGKVIRADGSVFEGKFVNNNREGVGKVTRVNGDTFEGNYVHGKRIWEGTMTLINGNIEKWDWIDDDREGERNYTYKNINMKAIAKNNSFIELTLPNGNTETFEEGLYDTMNKFDAYLDTLNLTN